MSPPMILGVLLLAGCSQGGLGVPRADAGADPVDLALVPRPDAQDGSSCLWPADRGFSLRVRELDGPGDLRCDGAPGPYRRFGVDVGGVVTASDTARGTLVVDTCPAWVACKQPRAVEITFASSSGEGLEVAPLGAFVELRAEVESFETHCTAALRVTSVASLGGRRNPSGLGDNLLYAEAGSGTQETLPGSPLLVEGLSTGCTREEVGGCVPAPDARPQELLQLVFAIDSAVFVAMGGSAVLPDTPGPRSALPLVASNLRSYSQSCADQRGFAWMVLPRLR